MPSSSIDNCAGVSETVPFAACGQVNFPRSSRFANRHNPSPSHHSNLIRSPRFPRNTNTCPENGFSFNAVCTIPLNPTNPRRMSVTPATIHIRVPAANPIIPATAPAPHATLPHLHARSREDVPSEIPRKSRPLLPWFRVQLADGPNDALCLTAFRLHAPATRSPPLHAPHPTTPADTDAATQKPGWHSLRVPAPPWPPMRLALTSPRQSAASPPPTAACAALSQQLSAPKCPLIPQVDTSVCAHKSHHP